MSDDNTTNIDPNLIADLVTSRLIQASGAASAAAQPDVVAATIKELRDGNEDGRGFFLESYRKDERRNRSQNQCSGK